MIKINCQKHKVLSSKICLYLKKSFLLLPFQALNCQKWLPQIGLLKKEVFSMNEYVLLLLRYGLFDLDPSLYVFVRIFLLTFIEFSRMDGALRFRTVNEKTVDTCVYISSESPRSRRISLFLCVCVPLIFFVAIRFRRDLQFMCIRLCENASILQV